MQLKETYKPRSIRFLELWQHQNWQMKLYGISYEGKSTDDALLEASKLKAQEILPQPAVTPDRFGLGFIGIHQGRSYDFVFIDWWKYDTELEHHSFMRASSSSSVLEPSEASELSPDVWDLRLLAHERDAWVETILNNNSPDVEAYLAKQLSEDV